MAAEIEVAEALRQLVRAGKIDSAEVQEKLHSMHAILEQEPPKTRANYLRLSRWGKRRRRTKTPAGARVNVVRDREIKNMSPEEFKNPVDPHPNRKISKTRVKAVLGRLIGVHERLSHN